MSWFSPGSPLGWSTKLVWRQGWKKGMCRVHLGKLMESKGYRRQGWAQRHISGCPGLSLREGPSLHAEGGWMGVKMRLVREAYGILVQLGWADKPRQFFFYTRSSYPWLSKFLMAFCWGILTECFLVIQADCTYWCKLGSCLKKPCKVSLSINYFKNCSPHIFTPCEY